MKVPQTILKKMALGGTVLAVIALTVSSLVADDKEEKPDEEKGEHAEEEKSTEEAKKEANTEPQQPTFTQEGPEHPVKWQRKITKDWCPPCGMG